MSDVDVSLAVPSTSGPFHIDGNGGGVNAGNLVLDGRLNVTSLAPLGPGVYRVMTYTGDAHGQRDGARRRAGRLQPADRSLHRDGRRPARSIWSATRAVAAAIGIDIWDGGNTALHDNDAIDGGHGTWQAGAANRTWTNLLGSPNTGWHADAFAIFQGTAGTVTVDNSAGAVTFSGAQFAVDGYTIAGQPLTTTTANTFLRVGDATFAGRLYSDDRRSDSGHRRCQ